MSHRLLSIYGRIEARVSAQMLLDRRVCGETPEKQHSLHLFQLLGSFLFGFTHVL